MDKKERAISEKEVKHLAWLARLELSEEEEKLFAQQLNDILNYFKKIDEVNVGGIQPTYHVLELTNVWRDDEVKPSSLAEEILKSVPQLKNKYIKAARMG